MRFSSSFDTRALKRGLSGDVDLAADTGSSLFYDGPITPRSEAIFWLSAAAEIEHALMTQYLFAAYSIDVGREGPTRRAAENAQRILLQIAREEMGHLITVQNVLTVIGGPVRFDREHSPQSSDVHPFHFRLEPVSLDSVAKYVVAESPDKPADEIDMLTEERKVLLDGEIQRRAKRSNDGCDVLHVGPIFAHLIELFTNDVSVDDYRLDRVSYQADWEDWGYDASRSEDPSPARGERVLVRKIDTQDKEEARTQVIDALQAIGDQGEYVDGADDPDDSHFDRFLKLFEDLHEIEKNHGSLPVLPVATYPNTSLAPSEPWPTETKRLMNKHLDEGRITNERARAWGQLFNLRYQLLIDVLGHGQLVSGPLYQPEPEAHGRRTPKGQLHAFAFAEMVRIRQLSAKLVSMPLDDGTSGLSAGPPFELGYSVAPPLHEADRWRRLADRFAAGSTWATRIRDTFGEDADDPFIEHLIDADSRAAALCLFVEKNNAMPVPISDEDSRFKDVMEALEEGVRGFDITTDPAGRFHGNFWADKTHEEFLELPTSAGQPMIKPGSPSESELFNRISTAFGEPGWMPRSRPVLPPERVRMIEAWIAAGAPDDHKPGEVGYSRPPAPKAEPRAEPEPDPEPQPEPGAPVFETDILPLFTDFHRNTMLFRLDLHSYDDVVADHKAIIRSLEEGTMPCPEGGGALPPGDVAKFQAWIDGGFRTLNDQPDEPDEPDEPMPPVDPGIGFPDGPYANHNWQRTNAPVAGLGAMRYDDIWHVTEDIGWAVNSDGNILATRDGWQTFTQQLHVPDAHLRCVGFANEQVGWVGTIGAADRSRLLKTTNGGLDWNFIENLPTPLPSQICGLWAVDENTLICAGSNRNDSGDPGPATVLKTTDGGDSWTEINMKTAVNARTLIDVFFEDANRGWVVGGVDTVDHPDRTGERGDLVPGIFQTTDGGNTWTNMVRGDLLSTSGRPYVGRTGVFAQGEWAWKIQRVDQNMLVVAIQNYRDGAILVSQDDGATWERLRINDRQRNSNLEGIGFLDRQNGWVGGYGDITYQPGYSSMTRDGGENWIVANSIGNRINRFRLVGSGPYVVYASGDTIYKFSDDPMDETAEDSLTLAATPAPLEGDERLDFEFDIPQGTSRMTVRIWERDGRFVRLLADEENPEPGRRTLTWNFHNDDQTLEQPGTFILRVTLDDRSQSSQVYRRPTRSDDPAPS